MYIKHLHGMQESKRTSAVLKQWMKLQGESDVIMR